MPDNKIQDIANEITAYKPYTFFSLIEKVLKENNAPFPEEVAYYLKRVFQGYTGLAPLRIVICFFKIIININFTT